MAHSDLPSARNKALHARMSELGIREKDIAESFVRSSGKGGQNVNKVSTCVRLKHVPTGIEVRSEESRLQAKNRFRAREILVGKFSRTLQDEELRRKGLANRARKTKWKRTGRAKERVLESKKKRSDKKSSRKKVTPHTE